MELKRFFAEGIATFINGLANLLNNDPKNPPDLIILEIWAVESFKSADISLLKAFLSSVFCLVVSTNSCGKSFPSNTLNLFPELFLFYFWQQFLVFLVEYLII